MEEDNESIRVPTKEMLELRLFGSRSRGSSERRFSGCLKYRKRLSNQDNREMYWEELRRQRQRRLGRRYHRETAQRLGVIKPAEITSSEAEQDSDQGSTNVHSAKYEAALAELNQRRLERAELQRQNFQPARLFNVSIHPCVGRGEASGNNVGGMLEANLEGFRYSDSFSVPFKMDVMYSNINYVFTQDGDENRAPLCHLILQNPIRVGSESRQNIQFRMAQTLEQQNSRDHDNKVMREFRGNVNHIFDAVSPRLRCKWVDKKQGFYGEVHPKDHPPFSTIFVFSFCILIQLEHTPFTAVKLDEIEIVNLVLVGSEMETINMTIVFKNFELDVLQITSIPSVKLISIKESLDHLNVKYYVNKIDQVPDWGSKLKEIRDCPKKFIKDGGWKFLDTEERANYSDSSGNEYSVDSDSSASSGSSYYDGIEPEQTCESVPKGKEKMEHCVSQTGYLSDSSMDSLADHNSGATRKEHIPLVHQMMNVTQTHTLKK